VWDLAARGVTKVLSILDPEPSFRDAIKPGPRAPRGELRWQRLAIILGRRNKRVSDSLKSWHRLKAFRIDRKGRKICHRYESRMRFGNETQNDCYSRPDCGLSK
jgi:hypothetical protein